ncbi:Retrovirus-related Pol polyprotein from transposon [Nosema granulosis]|uniref:Retrovirus-related Pol polyprotein from transposon n=1 Tax=Nosema granulosis TaxID=83296 RepID=A0A9P6GWH5_9MICR|nr:Retrovirus-related Pol polyprotein from transposon [Nosema granulosis]
MESQINKQFQLNHDKMSSSSQHTPNNPQYTKSNYKPMHTRSLGPLHLTNPTEAKRQENTYKSLKFPLKLKDVELEEPPQVTIFTFSNPHVQDILEWSKELRSLAITNEWTEETSKTILNLLIADEYKPKIEGKKTLDSKLDALCETVYNEEHFNSYRNLLTSARRNSFPSIETYFTFLDKVRERADLCLKPNSNGDKIPERDITDVVMKSLSVKEKEMLLNMQAETLTEIKKALIKHEKLQNLYNPQDNLKVEYNSKHPGRTPQARNYCSYHKSTTHNTNECVAYANYRKRNSTGRNNINNRELLAVNTEEIRSQANIDGNKTKLTLPSTLNGLNTTLIIDTGADLNFVSKEVAERIPNSSKTIINNTNILFANGSKEKLTEKHTVTFNDIRSGVLSKEEFYVIPSLPYDGILGQKFLQKHNCTICFKEGTVNLSKPNLDQPMNPDEEMLNKIYSPYAAINHVEHIVEMYKNKNPRLGLIKGCNMHLYLNDNTPVRKKPYPISLNYIPKVKEEIKKLLEMKIIRKIESPYAAPAFPKTKKNGDIRLLIDYRELNKKTIKQGYPFPSIQNSLTELKGSEIFSQLDLNMGYYQIQVDEQSIAKTAFVLPFGQYEFLRMPFGLSNAPREFQRIMNEKLADLNFVKVFVDDILIYSRSAEEHANHIEQVLKRLHNEGISINFDKSSFMKREVKYLGKISTAKVSDQT